MSKISCEIASNILGAGDLSVVNAARCSFDKSQTVFEEKDRGLVNYLVKHKHTTTLRHERITFKSTVPVINPFILNPFDVAGMVWHQDRHGCYARHSIHGWANLLKKGLIINNFTDEIRDLIVDVAPTAFEAYGFTKEGEMSSEASIKITDEVPTPWFQDVSLRCSAPITIKNQLVKHQVALAWNEVSRRYVSDTPEIHDQEFRYRPDGSIKQGSGDVMELDTLPFVEMESLSGTERIYIKDVREGLVKWYDECIDVYGVAPETIRGELPQNMVTSWIWTGPLPAFANVYHQRIDAAHAQKEVVGFAQQLDTAIKGVHPEMWEQLKES